MTSRVFENSNFKDVSPEVILNALVLELEQMDAYKPEGIIEAVVILYGTLTDLQKLIFALIFDQWLIDIEFKLEINITDEIRFKAGQLPEIYPANFSVLNSEGKLVKKVKQFIKVSELVIDDTEFNRSIWEVLIKFSDKVPFIKSNGVEIQNEKEETESTLEDEVLAILINELQNIYFLSTDKTYLISKLKGTHDITASNYSSLFKGIWYPYALHNRIIKRPIQSKKEFKIPTSHRRTLTLDEVGLGVIMKKALTRAFKELILIES